MPRKNIISLLLIFLAILLPFPISVSAQKTPLPQIAPAQTILKIDQMKKDNEYYNSVKSAYYSAEDKFNQFNYGNHKKEICSR